MKKFSYILLHALISLRVAQMFLRNFPDTKFSLIFLNSVPEEEKQLLQIELIITLWGHCSRATIKSAVIQQRGKKKLWFSQQQWQICLIFSTFMLLTLIKSLQWCGGDQAWFFLLTLLEGKNNTTKMSRAATTKLKQSRSSIVTKAHVPLIVTGHLMFSRNCSSWRCQICLSKDLVSIRTKLSISEPEA